MKYFIYVFIFSVLLLNINCNNTFDDNFYDKLASSIKPSWRSLKEDFDKIIKNNTMNRILIKHWDLLDSTEISSIPNNFTRSDTKRSSFFEALATLIKPSWKANQALVHGKKKS